MALVLLVVPCLSPPKILELRLILHSSSTGRNHISWALEAAVRCPATVANLPLHCESLQRSPAEQTRVRGFGVSGLEELQMRQTMKDVGMALSSSNKLSEKKS